MPSIKPKLLSLVLLCLTACSNDEDTHKKLREEIELKNRQKNRLQTEVAQRDEMLKAQSAEATKERELLLSEKTSLESTLAAESLKLEASLSVQNEMQKSSEVLSARIKANIDEINQLNEQIKVISPEARAAEGLRLEVNSANSQLAGLRLAQDKTELDLALSTKTLRSIMSPVFGMYYSEADDLIFDDKKCRQFVYVEASGRTTEAILCEDNRVQWEVRSVSEFAAIEDRRLIGQVGLQMKTSVADTSCGATTSVFASSGTYTFEKYLSSQEVTGSGTLGLPGNGQYRTLVSSAEKLLTEDCEGLLIFAENETVLDPSLLPLLKQAAQICKLVAAQVSTASLDAGCFTAPNIFLK